jgi:hypothetical protein
LTFKVRTFQKNDDGTMTYQVLAGTRVQDVQINKMFPETIFIIEGDTVEWIGPGHGYCGMKLKKLRYLIIAVLYLMQKLFFCCVEGF